SFGTTRLWLKKQAHFWRVYDFENVDISFRASILMALTYPSEDGKVPEWFLALGALAKAIRNFANAEFAEAEASLQGADGASFPPKIDAIRWLVAGRLKQVRQQWDAAIRNLDRAADLNPDLPILDLLRAQVENARGNREAALQYGRQYLAKVGNDANAFLEIGVALSHLELEQEALEAFRNGLRDEPDSFRNLF